LFLIEREICIAELLVVICVIKDLGGEEETKTMNDARKGGDFDLGDFFFYSRSKKNREIIMKSKE